MNNPLKDPKLGYNWIWMTPVVLVMNLFWKVCEVSKRTYHRIHINLILKKNPDINELSKLAGIRK